MQPDKSVHKRSKKSINPNIVENANYDERLIHDEIADMLKQIRNKYETWKIIDGYEHYSVSSFGRIYSRFKNIMLKPGKHNKGYHLVRLYKNNKGKIFKVHRLVAIAFIPNPNDKEIVDHIDGNNTNNHISNLRFASNKENSYNRRKQTNNTSGHKGVSYEKQYNKYRAKISIDGEVKHIGYFDTAEEASHVYEAKAKIVHKEYYYNTNNNLKKYLI